METETVETPTETQETDAPSFDVKAAAEKIGNDLFPDTLTEAAETPTEKVTEALATKEIEKPDPEPVKSEVTEQTPAPKSFRADLKDVWAKIPPEAQQYYIQREKQMLDGLDQYKGAAQYGHSIAKVLEPYQPLLQSKGLDAPVVINDLLNTYSKLTQGTMESRQAALVQISKNLGIAMPGPAVEGVTPPPVDPRLQTLEQKLQAIEDAQTQQQQAALQARRQQINAEIQAFVTETDKEGTLLHPFFDECHKHIVALLQAGESLQDAYNNAVWANPVTREKSKLSYFQTESEKAKERARLDALPKQKARSVNVQSRDTQRTPTDTLGSMEDTMRQTLRKIKERAAH